MFTGLVEDIGVLRRRSGKRAGTVRIFVETALGPLTLGESIDVNGACLTVDRIVRGGFEADMSSETLERSTLGGLAVGARLGLERATPLGARMGGHIVLGHVDGIGRVLERAPRGGTVRLVLRAPVELRRYLAPKASIAVDGVSLTLNELTDLPDAVTFDVMLVPHTLRRTALGDLRVGAGVNLEVDVLARYVARQLGLSGDIPHPGVGASAAKQGESDGVDEDRRFLAKLRAGGFA